MTVPVDEQTAVRARGARTAVFVVFALAGIGFSALASRVPDIRDAFGVSPAELGVILLALSVGAVVGLPVAGWIAARIGQANAVRLGMGMSAFGLLTVAAAVQVIAPQPVLMLGFFLAGSGVGIWDVSMNVQGAAVERALGTSVMPHFHAAFSAGTVVAALVGAGLSAMKVPVAVHLTGAVVIVIGLGMWATRSFLPRQVVAELDPDADGAGATEAVPTTAPARSAWTEPRTLLIGVLVFAAAFTEGTANDWLAVALVDGYGLSNGMGVFGLAVFLSFMTAGRILGTRWLDRYGRVAVLRVLFVVAAVGAGLVVFGTPVLAFVGAALWGLGASLGFPVGMSAAADDEARAPLRISVVATIGYMAFIAGPPLLGFLGEHIGVLRALTVVGALALLALLVLPAVREPDRRAA